MTEFDDDQPTPRRLVAQERDAPESSVVAGLVGDLGVLSR